MSLSAELSELRLLLWLKGLKLRVKASLRTRTRMLAFQRPHIRKLRRVQDFCAVSIVNNTLSVVSISMMSDFIWLLVLIWEPKSVSQ